MPRHRQPGDLEWPLFWELHVYRITGQTEALRQLLQTLFAYGYLINTGGRVEVSPDCPPFEVNEAAMVADLLNFYGYPKEGMSCLLKTM